MTVSRTNFEPLQKGLRGDLITPSDAGYDEARAAECNWHTTECASLGQHGRWEFDAKASRQAAGS